MNDELHMSKILLIFMFFGLGACFEKCFCGAFEALVHPEQRVISLPPPLLHHGACINPLLFVVRFYITLMTKSISMKTGLCPQKAHEASRTRICIPQHDHHSGYKITKSQIYLDYLS